MYDLVKSSILTVPNKILAMIVSLRHLLGWMVSAFHSREDLVLENLALRQQLLALHAHRPRRRLTALHKLFWVALQTFWSGWRKPLILVTPRTIVNWHRAGFRLYWAWISRVRQVGERKPVSKEVRALIFRMVTENPTWGAPRIHGELLKLGFDLSERSVSRWMQRAPRDPDVVKRWLTFLRNHREAIAAMDFFTVPTLTFGVLYCFFVIGHERRKILHFNVTRKPNSSGSTAIARRAGPTTAAPICSSTVTQSSSRGGCGGRARWKVIPPGRPFESLAERNRRALGQKRASRIARTCDRSERVAPEDCWKLRPVLPRRSDGPRARERTRPEAESQRWSLRAR